MTKNKWPKSDEKTGFGGTLGLEETQGDEWRIVPRPPQPKVRGGALGTKNAISIKKKSTLKVKSKYSRHATDATYDECYTHYSLRLYPIGV